MSRNECRVYVGNLPPDIRTKDIEDLFYRYGKILYVDLKNRRGPPFAFVEFEDPRDAEDAVAKRDGYDYDGYRLRVEFPRGGTRGRSGGGGGGGRGGDGRGRGAPARRSQYRVMVSGTVTTPFELHDDDDEQIGMMMMILEQVAMKEKVDHHQHLLPLNHLLLHNSISPSHHFFLPLLLLLSAGAAAEKLSSSSASSSSSSSSLSSTDTASFAPPSCCRIARVAPPKHMSLPPLSPALRLLLRFEGIDQYRSSKVISYRHCAGPPPPGA